VPAVLELASRLCDLGQVYKGMLLVYNSRGLTDQRLSPSADGSIRGGQPLAIAGRGKHWTHVWLPDF
jgi:hypothetical protein